MARRAYALTEAPAQGDRLSHRLQGAEWLAAASGFGLTEREAELLLCACDEDGDIALAKRLGIKTGTVHTHKNHIFCKLRVKSLLRAVCVVISARAGLVANSTFDRGPDVASDGRPCD